MRDIPDSLNYEVSYGWCATHPHEPDNHCGWCDRAYVHILERGVLLCPTCDSDELDQVRWSLDQ